MEICPGAWTRAYLCGGALYTLMRKCFPPHWRTMLVDDQAYFTALVDLKSGIIDIGSIPAPALFLRFTI
jgi:hypothetical protein